MSYLRLAGLGKTYRSTGQTVEALGAIDLEIERGELAVLVGPSGCGKTTLLRLVAGLEVPTRGQVLLAGRPVRGWSWERTLVFQDHTLFPWLTALDNVAFGLRLTGIPTAERRRRALALLDSLGLAGFARSYPHQLSGGMQQRVAIARALAVEPQVLLLDEPFASVDALTRGHLQDDLLCLQQARRQTVLLVTHSIDEALRLGDRVFVLSQRPGRLRAEFRLPPDRPRSPADLAPWVPRLQSALAC